MKEKSRLDFKKRKEKGKDGKGKGKGNGKGKGKEASLLKHLLLFLFQQANVPVRGQDQFPGWEGCGFTRIIHAQVMAIEADIRCKRKFESKCRSDNGHSLSPASAL